MKRTIKKGKIVLDQIKFQYKEDDNEEDDDDKPETWLCVDGNCSAEITVHDDQILLEDVSEKNFHKCKPVLKMTIMKTGMLDGFHFEKQEQDQEKNPIIKWKCTKCECTLQTHSDDLILKYPHSEKMHKCIH